MTYNIQISASFTAEPILKYISYLLKLLKYDDLDVSFAPYGNIFQEILNPNSMTRSDQPGFNVFLFRVSDFVDFGKKEAQVVKDIDGLLDQLFSNMACLDKLTTRPCALIFCPESSGCPGNPLIIRERRVIKEKLIKNLKNIMVVDTEQIRSLYKVSKVLDVVSYKVGKIPFTEEMFAALAILVVRKVNSVLQKPYKVLVVDCDQTLWDGVCAEVGPEGVVVDEPKKFFQQFLIDQHKQGKLICLCSKNLLGDVQAVFKSNKSMVLKEKHIVSFKVNWASKSSNIQSLSEELNLGLDSFVFVDDNSVECAEVRYNLPEVCTVLLPPDKFLKDFFNRLWIFDFSGVSTEEDRMRTGMYKHDVKRNKLKKSTISLEAFIKGLNIKIRVEPIVETQLDRACQLMSRTSQFNFTGLLYGMQQLKERLNAESKCLVVHVSDRFGDYGLVGVVLYKVNNQQLVVDNFLLSCRVLGRGVEFLVLNDLGRLASSSGCKNILVKFKSTERNLYAKNFLEVTFKDFFDGASRGSAISVSDAEKVKSDFSTPKNAVKSHVASKPFLHEKFNVKQALLQIATELSSARDFMVRLSVFFDLGEIEFDDVKNYIIALWQNLLGLSYFSVEDSFFSLAGDSLSAVRMISCIWDKYKVHIDIAMFFLDPTVNGLLVLIEKELNSSLMSYAFLTPRSDGRMEAPLSYSQQRVWFLEQLHSNAAAYNMPIAWKLKGKLNCSILKDSFIVMLNRHEIFRTIYFTDKKSEPRQKIIPCQEAKHMFNFSTVEIRDHLAALRSVYADFKIPFFLEKELPIRVKLIVLDPEQFFLIVNFHHIAFDGWSFDLFCKELSVVYAALLRNKEPPLSSVVLQYADFSIWQRQYISTDFLQSQLDFWTNKLKGFEEVRLPIKSKVKKIGCYKGRRISVGLIDEQYGLIKEFLKENKATLFNYIFSIFSVCIYNYTNQQKFIVGGVTSGRHYPCVGDVMGFFVNTLPLTVDLTKDQSLKDFILMNQDELQKALANQDLPFERMVNVYGAKRNKDECPLTKVMFILENFDNNLSCLGDVSVERVVVDSDVTVLADFESAKFNMTLYCQETNGHLSILLEYNSELLDELLVQQFFSDLIYLLGQGESSRNESVRRLSCLSPSHQLRVSRYLEGGRNPLHYPVQILFEKQLKESLDDTALVFSGNKLTYEKVNILSDGIAVTIDQQGFFQNEIVACLFERGFLAVLSLLGVSKSNNVYLPIDICLPKERVMLILLDCLPKIILVDNSTGFKFDALFKKIGVFEQVVNIEELLDHDKNYFFDSSLKEYSLNNPLYMIYTSGSAGAPKGVLLSNHTIANLVTWQKKKSGTSCNKVSQFASYGFDVSVQEIFYAFLTGSALYIVPEKVKLSISNLLKFMQKNNIEIIYFPTVVLHIFCQEAIKQAFCFSSLKSIIVAGEALHISESVRGFFKLHPEALLENHYGPSESHVVTVNKLIPPSEKWAMKPSIGYPIDNVKLFIYNDNLQTNTPLGVVGELCLSGKSIAKEYFHNKVLTKNKFVAIKSFDKANVKVYRTGDFVRLLEDGGIEYLRRLDSQVKIRGFRVELDEADEVLLKHKLVERCAVVVKGCGDNKYLAAYLVLNKSKENVNLKKIRSYLRKFLPEYMIPAIIVALDELPLTINGKVDKKLLTSAPDPRKFKVNIADRTVLQQEMFDIFSKALGFQHFEIYDDFFDIGGDSFLAIKVLAEINDKYSLELPVNLFMESPVVFDLAEIVKSWQATLSSMKKEVSEGLVCFSSQGSKGTLILFPPAGGGLFCYKFLVSLLKADFAVYGFQDFGVGGGNSAAFSMENAAKLYFLRIKETLKLGGRLILVGYSFGGILASYVQKLLLAEGVKIDMLVLIDSWPKFGGALEARTEFNRSIKKGCEVVGNLEEKYLNHWAETFSKHVDFLMTDFTLPKIEINLVLFKSMDVPLSKNDDTNYWSIYSDKTINVYPLPGDHYSALNQENSSAIAKYIAEYLE